ncbi:MAG: amidohydrolase [Bacteroidota bacterium]
MLSSNWKLAVGFVLLLLLNACQSNDQADLLIINATVVTMDEQQPSAEAVAIKGDRILKVGSTQALQALASPECRIIDLQGQFLMPGFIEGHGHFSGLGKSLINLNFLRSKNWQEIVNMVAERAKTAKPGEWIEGRGWHQEKWDTPLDRQIHGYPYHDELSAVSPNNPVILFHASGHSLFANDQAMKAAGVNIETPNPEGGEIVRDVSGEAIGVFEERAMRAIRGAYQEYLDSLSPKQLERQWYNAIELAQEECLSKGITSFQDAGSTYTEIERYQKMAEKQELDLRLWVMLRHSYADMKDRMEGFPILDAGEHYFSCRAIKTEVDGALGAFGAWLLAAYNDKNDFVGQNTTPISEVKNIAQLAFDNSMQLCVHAIGDRANRIVLDIMEQSFLKAPEQNDLRWRIEHAQHLSADDIPRFKELGVIASMQGIHCTSDAPFVVKRLGEKRARIGAYAWRSLLDSGVVIANGTDAPVEDVDPLECLYASVTRKRIDNGMEFFPEQSMTRQEALYSYTLGNAYAGFEEDSKGSLSEGKLADMVVLSNNLLTCTEEEILDTEVLMTFVGGELKYEKQ